MNITFAFESGWSLRLTARGAWLSKPRGWDSEQSLGVWIHGRNWEWGYHSQHLDGDKLESFAIGPVNLCWCL